VYSDVIFLFWAIACHQWAVKTFKMHRIKGPTDKKEQEGNSSGSSHKTRRKKIGKHNKSGYQPVSIVIKL